VASLQGRAERAHDGHVDHGNLVVFGVSLALMLVITYVFPYLDYRAASGSATGRALLTNVLPQQLAGQAITGYPVWGGAVIVVLGALALGSE
jgi:ABC-2 type transport system permease protein